MPEEKHPQLDTYDNPEYLAGQTEASVWTNRKVAACVIGAGLILSAPFVVSELDEKSSPNYSAAQTLGDRSLPTKEEDQCPEVPDSFVRKAERMLAAPENPDVSKAVRRALFSSATGNYLMNPTSSHDIQRKISNRAHKWQNPHVRFPVAQKHAQKLGLSVFDSTDYSQRVGDGINVDSNLTKQQVLRETQKFLKNYDVTVSLATEEAFPVTEPIGNETISDTIHTPQALYDTARIIATYPKEYLTLSGIEHIVLANGLKSGQENKVFNQTAALTDGKNIWFDVEHLNAYTFAHELGHGVLSAMCGGHEAAHNDPQLSEGMEGKYAYNPEYTGVSYTDYADTLAATEKRMLQNQPYQSQLRKLQNEVGNIATVTDYAYKNAAEDGAETISALTTDIFYKMRHAMAMPKLRYKLSVVFARLLYYRPHLAQYFMETSLKNEKSSSPLDAIMEGEPSHER